MYTMQIVKIKINHEVFFVTNANFFLFLFQFRTAINCMGGFYQETYQPRDPKIVNCPGENDRCIRIEATVEFFRVLNRK